MSVAILAACITITLLPRLIEAAGTTPQFWLMTAVAVVAAARGFVTSDPRGVLIVISPTLCFTFAILLCWGLEPAIVAHLVAMAVLTWRRNVHVWYAVLTAGIQVLAFTAASIVLANGTPDPFNADGPSNVVADAATVIAAATAWLVVFGLLSVVSARLRHGQAWRARESAGLVGSQLLFTAALLLLSPVLAVAANVNVAFVALVFIPLYAVERMARLSAERDRMAQLDPLTGLANRAGLKTRFDELVSASAQGVGAYSEGGRRLALLMLDLDRFKHVNDALGHEVGDQLLVAVSKRLADLEPALGVVARLGGDEFAILTSIPYGADQNRLPNEIHAALAEPVTLDGLRVDVTASVGVAVQVEPAEDFATLMRHADVAMYEAKQRGDAVAAYEPRSDHNSPERLGLLTEFRSALETDDHDQIGLHYQPQVSLDTGRVVGVEALLRWRHPVHGLIGTQELLQVAEHTSVMHLLTRRVIDEVVAQVSAWAAAGLTLRASFNASARDLYSGDIVSHLAGQLKRHQVSPDLIQLEITESALMADPQRAMATTARLSALGVAVALDDFGTGYSSLQHLRRLPLSELKIDRFFVSGMAHNGDDAAIVTSMVGMARSLGLRTVAEGVENERTFQLLADTGCTMAQGWFTAPPMPAEHVPVWLEQYARKDRYTDPTLPGRPRSEPYQTPAPVASAGPRAR